MVGDFSQVTWLKNVRTRSQAQICLIPIHTYYNKFWKEYQSLAHFVTDLLCDIEQVTKPFPVSSQ